MMLPWFDEPPELLAAAVASCAVIADHVVAADGAYEQVPDPRDHSDVSQLVAITVAAHDAGMTSEFLTPRLWKGQVEKRNALLNAASADADWVMPIDADWVLHGERARIRARLEEDVEQFYVLFHQPENHERDLHEVAPHQWHVDYNGDTRWEPMLFRALDEMRLEQTHWQYSGVRADGTRVGLSGGERFYPKARYARMPELKVEHLCMFRADKQLDRNRVYCERRDRERELVGYET